MSDSNTLRWDMLERDLAVLQGLDDETDRTNVSVEAVQTLQNNEGRLRLGRFEILREIGSGGHAIVFLARDPMLDRKVALKVPRPETLLSLELRERFLREGKTAALVSHPNVVQLYGAEQAGSVCYLEVEYCDGPTLADWLAVQSEPVDPRSAATIVRVLANAVHHIHSHGILHRDLKPRNVLLEPLTPGGGPAAVAGKAIEPFPFTLKIADFGLAKSLNGPQSTTRTGIVVGTPEYIAPEQADNSLGEVGPTTDVYALGAILYELFTGQPAFRADQIARTMARVIKGDFAFPRRLRPTLPRDVESICLKAMALDPRSRYVTAAELADDLQRFIDGRPVEARRVGRVERLGRWCRRRPVITSLVAALCLTFVAGFSAVTWQWRRAERQYNRAEKNFRQAHDAVRKPYVILDKGTRYAAPEFAPLRRSILQSSLKYYERLLHQRPDDVAVKADIAETHYRLAHIHEGAGRDQQALTHYAQALPLWETVVRQEPGNAKYRYLLAKTHAHAGIVKRGLRQFDEAEWHLVKSRFLQDELVRQYPNQPEYRRELAVCLLESAALDRKKSQLARALTSYRRAAAILKELTTVSPNAAEACFRLADAYCGIGAVLRDQGRVSDALPWIERSRETVQQTLRAHPELQWRSRELVRIDHVIGDVLCAMDKPDEALAAYRGAINRGERMLSEESLLMIVLRLDSIYWKSSRLHFKAGRTSEAIETARVGVQVVERAVRRHPEEIRLQWTLAVGYRLLGRYLERAGNLPEALTMWTRSKTEYDKLRQLHPENEKYSRQFAKCARAIAAIRRQQNSLEQPDERIGTREAIRMGPED